MQEEQPYILRITMEKEKVFSPWWSKIPLGNKIHRLLIRNKWPRKMKITSGDISFQESALNNLADVFYHDKPGHDANQAD